MEEEKDTRRDVTTLRAWLDTVPHGEYSNIRRRICEECFIKKSTLQAWIQAKVSIPMRARRDINRITMEVSGCELFVIQPKEI